MYRNLLRNINSKLWQKKLKVEIMNFHFERFLYNPGIHKYQTFVGYPNLLNFSSQNGEQKLVEENTLDMDAYIKPISECDEHDDTNLYKQEVLDKIRYTFRISNKQSLKLLGNTRSIKWAEVKKVLDILNEKNILKENILNNPWILKSSPRLLSDKFKILSDLMSDNNHSLPLCKHSSPRLQKLVNQLVEEKRIIPSNLNRFYYISYKLKLDPIVVCNYLAKRLFILQMPFRMLEENLNNMITYGVSSLSIIKDLWAFRYTPKSVKARLERAKNANKDKIMPWMVRCPERVLQRSLKLSSDETRILAEDNSNTVLDYIAKRLDIDVKTMEIILLNHAQVLTVRVTKVKEILDYLLNEEGFTKFDIAQVPRILCHGLQTTKSRMEELKAIGCKPSSLVILCKSRNEYEKFVNKWKERQEKIKEIKASI